MTARTWGQRHPRLGVLAAVLALVLAVGAVAWQGTSQCAATLPEPGPVRPRSEPIRAGGLTVQITRVDRAYALPADDPDDPDVHGPAGSELVLVWFTADIVAPATKDDALCSFALIGPDGTRWSSESDYGYALRRPDGYGCSSEGSTDIAPGRPVRAAVNFLIPAAAQGLVLEVELATSEQPARRLL